MKQSVRYIIQYGDTTEIQLKFVEAYLQDKLSMTQVATQYGISLSAVVYYLNKYKVSHCSRSDAVTQWNITKLSKRPVKLKKNLSQKEERLRLAGVMLYWAEGCKGWGMVKFVNSNPAMIKLFLSFLRKICGIWENRLKLLVHRYPDHNESELIDFWSNITQVPKKNFYKSFIHAGAKGTYKKKALYGTITIHYSDKKLLEKINFWISEYKEGL